MIYFSKRKYNFSLEHLIQNSHLTELFTSLSTSRVHKFKNKIRKGLNIESSQVRVELEVKYVLKCSIYSFIINISK